MRLQNGTKCLSCRDFYVCVQHAQAKPFRFQRKRVFLAGLFADDFGPGARQQSSWHGDCQSVQDPLSVCAFCFGVEEGVCFFFSEQRVLVATLEQQIWMKTPQ